MRVVLHQSPLSIFPNEWIDAATFDAPDCFRPIVGDKLRFSQIKAGAVGQVMVFVVSVEWVMTLRPERKLDCEMHLTVVSEMPAKTGTRRIHDNRKK